MPRTKQSNLKDDGTDSSSGLSSAPEDIADCNGAPQILHPSGTKRTAKEIIVSSTSRKRVKRDTAQASRSHDGFEEEYEREEVRVTTVLKKRRSVNKAAKTDGGDQKQDVPTTNGTPARAKRKVSAKAKGIAVEVRVEGDDEDDPKPEVTAKRAPKKAKKVTQNEGEPANGDISVEEGELKVKVKVARKRKTKEEKEAEAMPLAQRAAGAKMLIGAHVSSAGGVHNAVTNCVHIG